MGQEDGWRRGSEKERWKFLQLSDLVQSELLGYQESAEVLDSVDEVDELLVPPTQEPVEVAEPR